MNDSHENNEKLMRYENIEQQWVQIQNKMLANGIEGAHEFNSAYGESLFETIFYSTQNEYDVLFL